MDFQGTDRFEVRRRIGQGGMGVVYEAWDREQRQRVAIKTLRHVDPTSLYRLKNEFRSLRGIVHPNLVTLGELIEDAGRWFFTMELVDGVDVLTWVRGAAAARSDSAISPSADTMQAMHATRRGGGGRLDLDRLRAALVQLAAGLRVLHEAGKVHRDVKPSNVLVDGDGRLVVLDFGLVWDTEGRMTSASQQVVGTPEYMAPEQAIGPDVGPAADWYSVGVLLYEALSGRVPFAGPALRVLMEKQQRAAPPLDEPGLPADLVAMTGALLQVEPDARPTGAEIERAVYAGGDGPPPRRSLTRTAVFVGRERELARLDAAFGALAGGTGARVALCGESGVGKTTLVRHFSRQAEAAGATVLAGACYERELVPYRAVDGVIDALAHHLLRLPAGQVAAMLPRHVELVARMFPVMGRVEAIARQRTARGEPLPDPHGLRARAFDAVRYLLTALAGETRLVITIEDVQWADPDSLGLLRHLLAPPAPPGVLVVLTARSRDAIGDTLGPAPDVIEVGALEPDAARALSRHLAGDIGDLDDVGVTTADAIAADAAGHPFFIQELVRYAALSGRSVEGIRVDDAIRARIDELTGPGRLLLELLAVAGAPLAQSVLRGAADLEPAEFARQRAVLCTTNLAWAAGSRAVDEIALYHARIGDAVRARGLDDATALHDRLASALEREGVAEQRPELLVHHLENAGHRSRAAQYARRAGERAMAQFAFGRAEALFRIALDLGEFSAAEVHDLHLALGQALVAAGRGADAAEVFLTAAEHDDPVERLECRRLAAEQLMISGHIDRGLEVLDSLLVAIGTPLPSSRGRTMAALLWQRLLVRGRGLSWTSRTESQVSREALIHVDTHRTVSHGLSMVDNVRGALFNSRHLRLALRGGHDVRIGHALAVEAVYHASQGGRGLRRGARLVQTARELGERTREPLLQSFSVACDGVVAYFAGQFRDAVHKLGDATDRLERMRLPGAFELNNTRLFHVFTLRFAGQPGRARTLGERYLSDADSRGDRYFGTSLRRTLTYPLLAADQVDTARGHLARADWPASGPWFHVQRYYEIEALSHLGLYLGEADATLDQLEPSFEALAGSPLWRVQIIRSVARWLRALLWLASERPSAQALRIAVRASRALAGENAAYAPPLADVLAAAVAERRGDLDRARALWSRAIARAGTTDMGDVEAAARDRLGALLGGDEGADLRALAGEWLTGQQVADARLLDLVAPRPAPR